MMKSWKVVVASVLLMCAALSAQQAKPASVAVPYKLTFVISEIQDGKKINQRTYSTLMSSDDKKVTLKTGSRVPVVTGGEGANRQFQYLDIGVNIDVRLSQAESDWLYLEGRIDVSSILQTQDTGTPVAQPIVRQNQQEMHALIHPEKPTIIASLDDVSSPRTLQIEVTATRLK